MPAILTVLMVALWLRWDAPTSPEAARAESSGVGQGGRRASPPTWLRTPFGAGTLLLLAAVVVSAIHLAASSVLKAWSTPSPQVVTELVLVCMRSLLAACAAVVLTFAGVRRSWPLFWVGVSAMIAQGAAALYASPPFVSPAALLGYIWPGLSAGVTVIAAGVLLPSRNRAAWRWCVFAAALAGAAGQIPTLRQELRNPENPAAMLMRDRVGWLALGAAPAMMSAVVISRSAQWRWPAVARVAFALAVALLVLACTPAIGYLIHCTSGDCL